MSLLARLLNIATLASAVLLTACGGGGGGGGAPAGGGGGGGGGTITDAGFLKVALTDAPACGFNKINVTVQKVRVHASATAADGDPGWWEIILSPAQKVDLLALTNGAAPLELGQVQLAVGTYQQLSLVLAANDAANPLANSVVPFGGAETPLATPAALQGSLKIPVNIAVVKDQVSDYVIDFDACNSVLRNGASFELSARYSIIRRVSTTGMRVSGYVAPVLGTSTTRVSLQSGGTVVRSTVPDATGRFVLYPVPQGTYDLVISGLDRVPAVVTGVPANDATATDVNTSAAPIDPPSGLPNRTITGTVTTGTTPIDARVTILKTYAGGTQVVVFGAPANAATGMLSYTISAATPVRAPYVAGSPPVFAADNTVPPGQYTVAVTAAGTTKTAVADATAGDPPPLTFTFP